MRRGVTQDATRHAYGRIHHAVPDGLDRHVVPGQFCGKRSDDGKVHALDVKKGDKVLIGKYSGTEVKVDGEDLVVLREDDIMAVIA